jgi:hypothetical protein
MSAFDSYFVFWGRQVVEAQTKQFEPWQRGYGFGSRAPLNEWGPDEDVDADIPPELQDLSKPFFILGEEDYGSGLGGAPLLWALGHWHGALVDWAAARTQDQLRASALGMARAWNGEWGAGLRRQTALLLERDAAGARAQALTRQGIDAIFIQRRADALEDRKRRAAPQGLDKVFGLMRRYRGPDLAGLSRAKLAAALSEMTQGWSNIDPMDGKTSLTPLLELPPTRERCAALAACLHAGGRLSGGLGAPSAESLGALAEPARAPGPPTPEKAFGLLRDGFWRLFELELPELRDRPDFVQQAQQALHELCLSRVGAHWASGVFARHPWIAPKTIDPEPGTAVPLAEWLGARMGLSDDLLLPLLEQRHGATPALLGEALGQGREALARACAESLGGWAGAAMAPNAPEIAASRSALFALKELEAAGTLDLQRCQSPAFQEALSSAERRREMRPLRGDHGLDPSLACLDFLMERWGEQAIFGVSSNRLPSFFAWRDSQLLAEASTATPKRSAGRAAL